MNNIVLMGNLANDPELQNLPNGGRALCKFRMAVKRTTKDSTGKYICDFINVQAWGNTAEMVAEKISKGNRAIVQGALQISEYTKDGVKCYSPVVNANSVTIIDWANDFKVPQENDFSVSKGNNDNILW